MTRLIHGLTRAASLCATLLFAGIATAENRIALVIGNGTYDTVASLDNPTADAALMAQSLRETGFTVTLLDDTDQATLNHAIASFGRDLRGAGEDATGLFYYAGHGVQSFGTNYLLPTDVALTNAADLPLVGVEAQAVLRQMASARNRTNIVILDACRDNPFEALPAMDDNGLAEMKAPTGTFLAYSTAPGAVALDGLTGNSPFTEALAGIMATPGEPIEQLFKSVRVEVLRATNGQQVPWDTSSLTGDFAFVPAVQKSPAERAADALWDSVKDSADPVQVLLFLRAHPESAQADAARALLSRLIARSDAPGTAQTPAPEAPVVAVLPPDPAPATPDPAPALPGASEREMIEIARESRAEADYQAYLDAYPEGTYAELAAFELSIIRENAAKQAAAAKPVLEPDPQPEPTAQPVTFDTPLATGGDGVQGKTIEQLISGSPLFPPIVGLPEAAWEGKHCSNCHHWERDNLCTQAKTYLAENGARALSKEHPYGGGFKANLRRWAKADCP